VNYASKYGIYEIMWNANLMQQGNFIDIFLAWHVSGTYAIIRSIRCSVAAYGFLHRVFGWMVVLRAAAWVVCTVWMDPHTTQSTSKIVFKQCSCLGKHPRQQLPTVCTQNQLSYICYHYTVFDKLNLKCPSSQLAYVLKL